MNIEDIIDDYSKPLYNLALRVTGNISDAEDAIQDAFLNIYKDLDNFRGDSAIFTWLYRITMNAALMIKNKNDKFKRANLQIEVERHSKNIPNEIRTWMENPELECYLNELIWEIRIGCLQFMMDELTEEQRLPYILRYGFELSYADISYILDIPISSVKARLFRARKNLKKYYFAECNWFGNKNTHNCASRIGFAVQYDPEIIEKIKNRVAENPNDYKFSEYRKRHYPELHEIYRCIHHAPYDPEKIRCSLKAKGIFA